MSLQGEIRRWRRAWQRHTARRALLCFGVNEDFLSHHLLRREPRIELRPDDTAEALLRRLPRSLDLLLPALNLSDMRPLVPFRAGVIEQLQARGVVVVNPTVRQIGKRALHEDLRRVGLPTAAATRDGDPEERLIVKSNYNSGGQSERLMSPAWRAALGLPEVPARVPERNDYRVCRRGELDPAAFDDPLLAVERFIERDDDLMLRFYIAGDRGVLFRILFAGQVKRLFAAQEIRSFRLFPDGESFAAEEPLDGFVPPILADCARFCRGIGLQYGSLDVMLDRQARGTIIDLNTTPFQGPMSDALLQAEHLRAGLLALGRTA